MVNVAKRVASKLPSGVQRELHRWLCNARIRGGRFTHYEPEYAMLSNWVGRGDTVLDIGANLGIYTARLSELVGDSGHVFAFEPVARSFDLLCSNAKLFSHRNVTLLNVAASDKSSFVKLDIPHFENGLRAFTRASIDSSIEDVTTSLASFSVSVDALQIPSRIRFAKIDVEGHEEQVLYGMKRTLREDRPTLVVEGADQEISEWLARFGYERTVIAGSPNSVYRTS